MIGDQHQIKQLRYIYNSQLAVKMELERELRCIKDSGYRNQTKEAELILKIIELKCDIVTIDNSINQLSLK
jgi:hypothetical protein